jgi:hypothetical protein
MKIAGVEKPGRDRRQAEKDKPAKVFPVIDPHWFKIPISKTQIPKHSGNSPERGSVFLGLAAWDL